MAIKSLADNTYYKINWNDTVIQRNKVVVALSQYLNEEERLKEKSREGEIASFVEKLHGIVINETDDTPREKSFRKFLVVEGMWSKVVNQELIYKPDEWYEPLFEIGFKLEWIKDPVVLQGKIKVTCGDFDNCAITMEYLYEKLKSVMAVEIVDC